MILRDEKERKLFDDLLCVKRQEKIQRQYIAKNIQSRKMISDLQARERAAFARCAREEEEVDRIPTMHSNNVS
ncbi:hypothetical protein CQW23_10592 [Capsicum baccatum]|uniref:Uncharacterized protein n=1 Tax=Capsicum baccatum TaxID=33114 RepID=A0A2G2X059_CAPBA|nr:hypothetical protein CQW23_10592 [Capsicum baccatum]